MFKCIRICNVLMLLISFVNFSCNQDQADNKIFRNINLGKYGTLVLGENFESKDKLAIKIDDNIYRLRQNIFCGATLIDVYLNDAGMVAMMRFEYSPDTNYYEHVKIYSEILGTPSQTQQIDSLKKSIWDDGFTRFEYIKESGKNKSLMYSALYDKELWGE